jgi:hypothetical protein
MDSRAQCQQLAHDTTVDYTQIYSLFLQALPLETALALAKAIVEVEKRRKEGAVK